MLECNKNYTILALNCILKNSKRIISVLEIKRRNRNNSINRIYKNPERALVNTKEYS